MKRVDRYLIATYEALLKDFVMWGTLPASSTVRDLSRIVTLVETRGARTLLVDFPSMGKALDSGLSRGFINTNAFSLLGGWMPSFMKHSWSRVFSNDGRLLEDADLEHVKCLRQVLFLCKKVSLPTEEKGVKLAVEEFYSIERNLRDPSGSWDSCYFRSRSAQLSDASTAFFTDGGSRSERVLLRLAERVADCTLSTFPFLCPEEIVGRHGPGSVSDAVCGLDKFQFPHWPLRVRGVFSPDLHAHANLGLTENCEGCSSGAGYQSMHEASSKLIPVPKTLEKPRIIASEPIHAQFLQGGIRRWLVDSIAKSFVGRSVTIHDQTPSQDLARIASRDSRLATVDLSSASDRLSCWTVERCFRSRPDILRCLAASRSIYMAGPLGPIRLRKYAPQGNATVFPVQSLVYFILSVAAVHYASSYKVVNLKTLRDCARSVRVYGDDIVIPTKSLPYLSLLLELCQLKVNGGKSHYSGNFAESCGFDGFRGECVTPSYLRSIGDTKSVRAIASLVEVSNNFHREGLINTGNVISGWIDKSIRYKLLMAPTSSNHFSLRTFSPTYRSYKSRWNVHLQRMEVRCLVPKSSGKLKKRNAWSDLFQYFLETAEYDGTICHNPHKVGHYQSRPRPSLGLGWVEAPRR